MLHTLLHQLHFSRLVTRLESLFFSDSTRLESSSFFHKRLDSSHFLEKTRLDSSQNPQVTRLESSKGVTRSNSANYFSDVYCLNCMFVIDATVKHLIRRSLRKRDVFAVTTAAHNFFFF